MIDLCPICDEKVGLGHVISIDALLTKKCQGCNRNITIHTNKAKKIVVVEIAVMPEGVPGKGVGNAQGDGKALAMARAHPLRSLRMPITMM